MRKKFSHILKEAELNLPDNPDDPLFKSEADIKDNASDDFENDVDVNDKTEESTEVEDPTFTFEVDGDFNYNELERIVKNNDIGTSLDKIYVKISLNGKVNEEDYQKFIEYIESKMRFFKFSE